jgi:hypothetical protein
VETGRTSKESYKSLYDIDFVLDKEHTVDVSP